MECRQLPSVKQSNSPRTSLERFRVGINLTLALACVVGGAVVLTALVVTRPSPSQRRTTALPLSVAVETVLPCVETTPVVGYGTVGPKHEVDIIPQVSGKLVYVHEDLAVGKTIAAGETLFEIECTLYTSRVAQAEAEKRRLEAVDRRYDVDAAILDERVGHAERLLAIAEEQYRTTVALHADEENPAATALEVSADEERFLRQKDALAELRSRREMIPHLRAETQALLDAAEARLERARVELAHTKIVCPFDARVESVSAYTAQVVTAFFAIARLTSLEAFEISVGIDPRELAWLAEGAHPDTLTQEAHEPSAEVVVRSTVRGVEFEWRGYVTRFERMDEGTRTARMVVEVQQADLVARGAAERPGGTLSLGMFCRTELPARPLAGALLVPRRAIYENLLVYVFEPDEESAQPSTGHLGQRLVPLLRSVDDSVLVDYEGRRGTEVCELQAGEQVVVSPLLKPVVGMRLRARDVQVARVEPQRVRCGPSEASQPPALLRPLLASAEVLTGTR